jgi:hypothetical protein
LQRETEGKSPFVFLTERGGPMTRNKARKLAGFRISGAHLVAPCFLRRKFPFSVKRHV